MVDSFNFNRYLSPTFRPINPNTGLEVGYNYDSSRFYYYDSFSDIYKEQAFKSLEYLLLEPKVTNDENINEETKKKLTLIDYQKRNLNNLKEDLIYYFISPELLSSFKGRLEEDLKYDFYRDIDCENFLAAQKERFKHILSISQLDLDQEKNLDKFNNFCYKSSIIKDNAETKLKLTYANIIKKKLMNIFI